MKANYRWGGAVNTEPITAGAALSAFSFVVATLSTGKVAACVDDATAILGMAMSPASADGDEIEVALALPGVIYTIPIVENATYTAAAATAAAASGNKKAQGRTGFAGYIGKFLALEVDTDGIHKIDLADAGHDALQLVGVDYDWSGARWLAVVRVIDTANQALIEWA